MLPDPIPQRARAVKKSIKEIAIETGTVRVSGGLRANGSRFIAAPPKFPGSAINRASGPMPVRLEILLMQHGAPALQFLRDVFEGRIPGVSVAQRIDAATTIAMMVSKLSGDQTAAFAVLLRDLDPARLTDAQLSAILQHRDDASAAFSALLNTAIPTTE